MSSKPPIARQHCRHYSYPLPITVDHPGPQCAVDCDLSSPGAARACMPNPSVDCPRREEWTAEERATWEAWQADRTERMLAAIAALPPLVARSSKTVPCPNCDGNLTGLRTVRRAYVECSTEDCVGFETALKPNVEHWP